MTNPFKTVTKKIGDGVKAVGDGAVSGVTAVGEGAMTGAKSIGGGVHNVAKVTDSTVRKTLHGQDAQRDLTEGGGEEEEEEKNNTNNEGKEEEHETKEEKEVIELSQQQNLEPPKPKNNEEVEDKTTTKDKKEYVKLHPAVEWFLLFYPIIGGFVLSMFAYSLSGGSLYSFVVVPAFLTAKVLQVALRFLIPFLAEADFMALYDHALRWQDRIEKFMGTEQSKVAEDGGDGAKKKESPHTLKGVVGGVGAALNPLGHGGGEKTLHKKET